MTIKYLSISLLALLSFGSCQLTDKNQSNTEYLSTDNIVNTNTGTGEVDPDKAPVIEWSETKYDFGEVSQGEVVKHVFTFKNVGGSPLLITSVKPSCSCTVIDNWPKEPLAPGEGGEIVVEFDTEGKKGNITKTVSVVANTQVSTNIVSLVGNILTPGS